jgi:hypothetical protein
MLLDCPRCGLSSPERTTTCPGCGLDLRESHEREGDRDKSALVYGLRVLASLGGALLGVPMGGSGLPDRSLVRGRWRTTMIAGKVLAVAGCLWAVIAFHTARSGQIWAAAVVIGLGISVALLGRASPGWRGKEPASEGRES